MDSAKGCGIRSMFERHRAGPVTHRSTLDHAVTRAKANPS